MPRANMKRSRHQRDVREAATRYRRRRAARRMKMFTRCLMTKYSRYTSWPAARLSLQQAFSRSLRDAMNLFLLPVMPRHYTGLPQRYPRQRLFRCGAFTPEPKSFTILRLVYSCAPIFIFIDSLRLRHSQREVPYARHHPPRRRDRFSDDAA